MTGTTIYDCPRCGPTAAWESHLRACPGCDSPCGTTTSHGARLTAWGRNLSLVLGTLELDELTSQIRAELDPDQLDQLGQLADWLLEEGERQQVREELPPLQLVSA